jgi:hypothetical protein
MAKLDHTAPRKKTRLLRWVRRYNRKNPASRIVILKGFSTKTPRVGAPARELIKEMQRRSGAPHISGQFDEWTMLRLFPPTLRGRVMAIAHSQLGIHEWPPNSNSGPVRKFLTAAGYPWAGPWCAAFVTWCLLKAGVKRSCLPANPASVESWLDHARAHGCLKPVSASKMGDLWVWGLGGNPHAHLAFCDDTNMRDPEADGLDGNVGDYGGEVTHTARSEGLITACIDVVKLSRIGA